MPAGIIVDPFDFVRPMSHAPVPFTEHDSISGVRLEGDPPMFSCLACGESSRKITWPELIALRAGINGVVKAGNVGIEWRCPGGHDHAVVTLKFVGPFL